MATATKSTATKSTATKATNTETAQKKSVIKKTVASKEQKVIPGISQEVINTMSDEINIMLAY